MNRFKSTSKINGRIQTQNDITNFLPNRLSANDRKSFHEITNKILVKQEDSRTLELMKKSLQFIKGGDNRKKDQQQYKLQKQQVELTQPQEIKDFIQQNSHLKQLLIDIYSKYNPNDEEILCYVQELKKSLQNLNDFSGEQIQKIEAKAPVPSQFQAKQYGHTHKKSKQQFQKHF